MQYKQICSFLKIPLSYIAKENFCYRRETARRTKNAGIVFLRHLNVYVCLSRPSVRTKTKDY